MMVLVGGVGEDSYSQNSTIQAGSFNNVKLPIGEAIKRTSAALFANARLIRIADLGCSSGPNSVEQVDFVVNEIILKQSSSTDDLQIQVFFSDLATNDFNNLFSLLDIHPHHTQGKPYFYCAAPGSFYNRLFPSSSIHVAMCNIALHWISKVPHAIIDKHSPAFNAGRTSSDKFSTAATVKAFAEQAHEDILRFLRHRAEELVSGGILMLLVLGRPSEEQITWEPNFQAAWEELVDEELITQERLDTYNTPMYFRSESELDKALQLASDYFEVILKKRGEVPKFDDGSSDLTYKLVNFCKALTKTIVQQHLGDEKLVESVYQKMESIIERRTYPQTELATFTVVLRRT